MMERVYTKQVIIYIWNCRYTISGDTYTLPSLSPLNTGDLCRRLPDGRIQFIGRSDKQIKLNGYRIEIGDIQGAMGSKVQNSHVMIDNGQLIAFIMPKIDISETKKSLSEKLPTVSTYPNVTD